MCTHVVLPPYPLQWSVIMVGAFDVDWSDLGKYPFRTDMDEFDPSGDGGALGESVWCHCFRGGEEEGGKVLPILYAGH